jgi:hypothetical protein
MIEQQLKKVHQIERDIKIYFRTLTGKTVSFEINEFALLSELKGKIQDREGIPIEVQMLVFSGKLLYGDKPLPEYGIKNESTIYLVMRLRGADPEEADTSSSNQSVDSSNPKQFFSEKSEDLLSIPFLLDEKFEESNKSYVRQLIFQVEENWTKESQSLLSKRSKKALAPKEILQEKLKAFDLLDALSRSGDLVFENAEMHIVNGINHCFDESLVDTIVKKNINPIQELDSTALIAAATIYHCSATDLLFDSASACLALNLEMKKG